MFYKLAFYIVSSYLFIAFLVAFYVRNELFRQLSLIEKLGEMKGLSLGLVTTAVLWPIWLVKSIWLSFVLERKKRKDRIRKEMDEWSFAHRIPLEVGKTISFGNNGVTVNGVPYNGKGYKDGKEV